MIVTSDKSRDYSPLPWVFLQKVFDLLVDPVDVTLSHIEACIPFNDVSCVIHHLDAFIFIPVIQSIEGIEAFCLASQVAVRCGPEPDRAIRCQRDVRDLTVFEQEPGGAGDRASFGRKRWSGHHRLGVQFVNPVRE